MKPEEVTRFLESVRYLFHGRPISDELCLMSIGSLNQESERISVHIEEIDLQDKRNGEPERNFGRFRVLRLGGRDEDFLVGIRRYLILTIGKERLPFPCEPQIFRSPLTSELTEEAIKHTFVWSKGVDSSLLSRWWDGVALTPFEDEVTKALKLIAPSVSAVTFVNRSTREGNPERIPVVRVESRDFPIPMKSLGEGVNRMFGLALALVSSQNGLLMVDEIETGLHYSVQADMWRLVFKTARELNVQVFATTHSSDCIRAFEEAAREDTEAEGMLIRLENKNGKVRAVAFDEEDLEIVVNEGIEVR